MTTSGLFVVSSELRVRPNAACELTEAFRDRGGLEVWHDQRDTGRFLMTSWWDSRAAFAEYMRSDDHRRSHDRIPVGPARPEAVSVTRFDVVAR